MSSQHNYYTDCKKGEYKLRNPQKYMPDIDPPVFKSSWEEKFFILCDVNPFVTLWGYEPFGISYYSPLYMRQSIYKPDIYLECKYQDGFVDRYLIEIKPDSYATIAVEDFNGRRELWKNPSDYDNMVSSYRRVKEATGIED